MKKLILAAAAIAASITAWAAPSLSITFNGEDNAGITFGQNAVSVVADGHVSVEMGVQNRDSEGNPNKWRADVIYNAPASSEGFTFDPAVNKIVAIKFIGDRPAGNLTFEVQNPDIPNTYYKKNNTPNGTVDSYDGNKIIYYDLSAMSGYSDAEPFTTRFFQLKVADNTAEPHSYTLDWIKVYESVDALKTDKNWKDDGVNDDDEHLPVANVTSGLDYETLDTAISAAEAGDELLVKANVALSDRRSISKKLTIRGASQDICIDRTFTKLLLIIEAETHFENLTFTCSKGGEQNNNYLEVNKSALYLDNIVFSGIKTMHNQGLVALKVKDNRNSQLYANNISFVDCVNTSVEGPGFIHIVGNCSATLDGQNENVSVTFEKRSSSKLSVGENFATSAPIKLYYKEVPTMGQTVVSGTENFRLFELGSSDKYDASGFLAPGNGTVILTDAPYVFPVVNETTGAEFKDFDSALNAAENDDVLLINSDIVLGDRVTLSKKLTFRGASQDVCIKRNFDKIMMLVNANTTFENITLSSIADELDFVYLEVNKVNLFCNDVIFSGISSKKDQGIVAMKGGGRFFSNNVSFVDCSSTNPSCPGFLFLGTNGQVNLDGENENVSVTIENINSSIYVDENFSVTNPVGLSVKYSDIKMGETKIVRGTTDDSLFSLVNLEGYKLSTVNDYLVLDGAHALHIDFWAEHTGWDAVFALISDEDGHKAVIEFVRTTPKSRAAEDEVWQFMGNMNFMPTAIRFMNMADPTNENCEKTNVCAFENKTGYEALTSSTAEGIDTQVKEGTTGVETIDVDADNATDATPAEYFDLNGRRVESPAHGIYIERRGTTIRKVAL